MKRFLSLLLVSVSLLGGCKKEPEKKEEETHEFVEPHYNEVEDLHIHWNALFDQPEEDYYVYVYFVMCTACSSIREQITSVAKSGEVKIYFVYPSDDVPFTDDLDVANASLGQSNLENVNVYMTPTLIEVKNKVISTFTNDYSTIKNFLDSFGD